MRLSTKLIIAALLVLSPIVVTEVVTGPTLAGSSMASLWGQTARPGAPTLVMTGAGGRVIPMVVPGMVAGPTGSASDARPAAAPADSFIHYSAEDLDRRCNNKSGECEPEPDVTGLVMTGEEFRAYMKKLDEEDRYDQTIGQLPPVEDSVAYIDNEEISRIIRETGPDPIIYHHHGGMPRYYTVDGERRAFPPVASVPEPSSVFLLVLGLAAVISFRHLIKIERGLKNDESAAAGVDQERQLS